ncbi:MAG TPA: FAD-binding dehydrogenase [Steroidobacteraceae bacterium]|nr:FAD-binding dehydrogenase [Steroidobacteraceae bacterium]
MIRYKADVVVIGAGIAGVAAAIELIDRGRSVLLIDRDVEENMGALAKESFGGIWFAGTDLQRRYGIRDGAQQGLEDWHAYAEFGDADHWPKAWAKAYVQRSNDEIYRWLKTIGVQFMPMPLWVERGLHTPGNSVPRWHIVWGTGHELAVVLNRHLLARPNRDRLQLRFNHRVESLVTTGGRVTGCRGAFEGGDGEFEASAEAVIVAAGGINGNIERVRQHWHADWGRPPEVILNGSHRYADGRLHDAAAALGASITHLDWQWNYAAGVHHWRPRKPGHGLSLVPPKSALWLNWRGERIGPMPLVTGYDTHDLVGQICHQDRGYSWQLLNRRIMLKELAISGGEFNPAFRSKDRLAVARDLLRGNLWLYGEMTAHCPDVVVAPTVDELVEKMNALTGDGSVDGAALKAAAARYDACIDRGPRFHDDEQLRRIEFARRWVGDRLRTCKFQKILDPKAGPLVAIREFIISRKSMGGLQTDLDCRVLDLSGQPIAGLFAAGESAGFGGGGMNGKRGLEGTFLGGCLLGGRIAGRLA